MMGHKICIFGKIWIIIPKLSLLSLLIWSIESPGEKSYISAKIEAVKQLQALFLLTVEQCL